MNNVVAAMPSEAIVEVDELLADREEFFGARRLALRRAATTQEVEEAVRLAAARRLADRLVERELPLEAAAELRAAGPFRDHHLARISSLHCCLERAGTKRQSFDRNQEPGSECS